MEEQNRMCSYEFTVSLTAVSHACIHRLDSAGIKAESIGSDEICSAEIRLARSLAPLGYRSEYLGDETLYITLFLREDPMGYFWFGRDMSAALVAAVIARRCRNRRKACRLWRSVYDEICSSISAVCRSTPTE